MEIFKNKRLEELQKFVEAQSKELVNQRATIQRLSGQINTLSGASIATPTTSRLIGSGNPPDSAIDLNIFASVQSSLGEVKDIDMWLWNYFFDDLIYKTEWESQADPSEMIAKGYLWLNGGIYSRLNYLGGLAKLPTNYYTVVDADTIQMVDYTNCFKRMGNNSEGIQGESLPQHVHPDNHSHNLSSAGKATGITNLGGAELKFDENGDGAESLNQSAAAFTNFSGHVVARNNGSVRTVTMGSSSGTSYSRGFQINIPDLNLKGVTDTRTGNTANANNGIYQDSAPVRPKNYSTNVYMFGGRYIGSTQSQSYQLNLDLGSKKGKKEIKPQIIRLPDNNGYSKRYMKRLNN